MNRDEIETEKEKMRLLKLKFDKELELKKKALRKTIFLPTDFTQTKKKRRCNKLKKRRTFKKRIENWIESWNKKHKTSFKQTKEKQKRSLKAVKNKNSKTRKSLKGPSKMDKLIKLTNQMKEFGDISYSVWVDDRSLINGVNAIYYPKFKEKILVGIHGLIKECETEGKYLVRCWNPYEVLHVLPRQYRGYKKREVQLVINEELFPIWQTSLKIYDSTTLQLCYANKYLAHYPINTFAYRRQ